MQYPLEKLTPAPFLRQRYSPALFEMAVALGFKSPSLLCILRLFAYFDER